MNYAVIKTGGKQYKVKVGQEIEVEKLSGEPKEKIVFDKVLLLVDKKDVKVGKPYLNKVKIEAVIVSQEKGTKIHVYKYKSKSRYRRKTGHRQPKTRLKIEKIAYS